VPRKIPTEPLVAGRADLPGNAEPVPQPATRLAFTTLSQLFTHSFGFRFALVHVKKGASLPAKKAPGLFEHRGFR